ncbi:MAG: V-type ATP synthase subunit F [Patescibacteria group bacterium]|nr:V-type ATP synthase subunit F [Patescibacteria group bacterium]
MEYKIGIIGHKDVIFGFKAFNLEIFPITNLEEGKEAIKKISQDNFAIVFITEDWEEKLEEELLPLKTSTIPAVVSLPTHLGSTGYGLRELKKIVEKAVGSDILFQNKK